jgi:hypothetical protein
MNQVVYTIQTLVLDIHHTNYFVHKLNSVIYGHNKPFIN